MLARDRRAPFAANGRYLSERICRDQLTSASSLVGRENTPENGKTEGKEVEDRYESVQI